MTPLAGGPAIIDMLAPRPPQSALTAAVLQYVNRTSSKAAAEVGKQG